MIQGAEYQEFAFVPASLVNGVFIPHNRAGSGGLFCRGGRPSQKMGGPQGALNNGPQPGIVLTDYPEGAVMQSYSVERRGTIGESPPAWQTNNGKIQ